MITENRSNPFAARSTLEYELPPFVQVKEEHYLPAFTAGYHGYIWPQLLDADTVEWFKESGASTVQTETTSALTCIPAEDQSTPCRCIGDFRGRDVEAGAVPRRRGL